MDAVPPTPPADAAEDKYVALLSKFQRDINRMQDADRNTRHRGLQKLLTDLPWTGKGGSGTKKAVRQLLGNNVLPVLLGLDLTGTDNDAFRTTGPGMLSDPVEKCRALSLQVLKTMLDNVTGFKSTIICATAHALALRVSETPFPEAAEELRLVVVENLHATLRYSIAAHLKALSKEQGPDVATAAAGEEEAGKGPSDAVFEQSVYKPVLGRCVAALGRALHDPFPAAKRAGGELAHDVAIHAPILTRLHFKTLATGLAANCAHQHSKTRSVSLQALGHSLSTVKDEFDVLMGTLDVEGVAMDKAGIVAVAGASGDNFAASSNKGRKLDLLVLFSKLVCDGNASVRRTLAVQLGLVLRSRFGRYNGPVSSSAELQALVLVLLLLGDDIDEVRADAMGALEGCLPCWTGKGSGTKGLAGEGRFDENAHIVDGEAILRAESVAGGASDASAATAGSVDGSYAPRTFCVEHADALCALILRGVNDWTAVSQKRYLVGLNNFMLIGGAECIMKVLPELLNALGGPCRDDEASTREAAEACCARIGCMLSADPAAAISLLVPRVGGEAMGGGGDTASLRSRAILELTHILKGLSHAASAPGTAPTVGTTAQRGEYLDSFPVPITTVALPLSARNTACTASIIAALEPAELYEFREPYMRESLLLLVRSIIDSFPHLRADIQLERSLLLSLLYLQGRCPGESDIVPDAASSQMLRLACPAGDAGADDAVEPSVHLASLFSRHFRALLDTILASSLKTQGLPENTAPEQIEWAADSVSKSAFDTLIRTAPAEAWKHHELILTVMVPQVQLPAIAAHDTPEAHLETYKAQRGDTDVNQDAQNASTRLSLMALLETWVRRGAQDWTCGAHLSEAASTILKKIVCGSLVWRVGRVEATVRKVTLAVTHALLRAGAVKPATLYEVAGELVPQITSQMDDHETSVRHMSALCLNVVFERLKGAFGYQAVSELYPMLIKRLDDSNDEVRVQACKALGAFMAAASAGAYSGTALDYTLDQLFIHLDDPDAAIQAVVYGVILIGVTLNKDLVWKKAHENLATHRTTTMCDRLIRELKG